MNKEASQIERATDEISVLRDAVITLSYRQALGREPDQDGLETYRALLRGDPLAATSLTMPLAESDEGRAYSSQSKHIIDFRPGSRRISGNVPQKIVSLGSRCVTAQLLANATVRDVSFPFDWIFSTPEIVVRCLEDDFALMLKVEEYEEIQPDNQNRNLALCDHKTFRDEFGQSDMFNHRNPKNIDDYAYLLRCINRLRALRGSAQEVLFILITDNHPDPVAAYVRLYPLISRVFGQKAALLFVEVRNRASQSLIPIVTTELENGNHELLQFNAVGTLGGLYFDEAVDQATLMALIRRYQI